MKINTHSLMRRSLCGTLALLTVIACASTGMAGQPSELTVVVMDPLSSPLACDCVQGYAQRKYEFLGSFLQQELKRPVKVYWSESLQTALDEKTSGKADLIIGKHSVVLAGTRQAKLKVAPVAALTDMEGVTTQTGFIVVRKNDAAETVKDLTGYRIFFGPADCDEKSAAPMKLLRANGVAIPKDVETSDACSSACKKLMELPVTENAAAVISSYAQPLLEGCGTIEKGDLRIVGESAQVPFITAFVNTGSVNAEDQAALTAVLMKVGDDVDLLIHLETGLGFVPMEEPSAGTKSGARKVQKKKAE